jgi:hypothetical protein
MCLKLFFFIPGIGPNIFLEQMADQSWEYINRSQTPKCGSWDCGPASFAGNKNGIFVAVQEDEIGAKELE